DVVRDQLADAEAHDHHRWRSCRECGDRLAAAMAEYRGEFLADVTVPDSDLFEQWASEQRRELHQRATTATHRLVERSEWLGDHAAAIGWARRLVALDPYVEA